jgi:putative ABC transport system substrate-binding protein
MLGRTNRRAFVAALGSAAVWPMVARAQQSNQACRIGVLQGFAETDPEAQTEITAFRRALQSLGWTGERNVRIAYRWCAGDLERMRTFAKELVALQPDVILATTTPAVAALLRESRTVPIVFARVALPVEEGFVPNLARPGGNVTGFAFFEPSLVTKWLELLKEIAPP